MVDEMLFEHEAPLFDDIKQSVLHAAAIHSHPAVEHLHWSQTLHLLVDFLIPTGQ